MEREVRGKTKLEDGQGSVYDMRIGLTGCAEERFSPEALIYRLHRHRRLRLVSAGWMEPGEMRRR